MQSVPTAIQLQKVVTFLDIPFAQLASFNFGLSRFRVYIFFSLLRKLHLLNLQGRIALFWRGDGGGDDYLWEFYGFGWWWLQILTGDNQLTFVNYGMYSVRYYFLRFVSYQRLYTDLIHL